MTSRAMLAAILSLLAGTAAVAEIRHEQIEDAFVRNTSDRMAGDLTVDGDVSVGGTLSIAGTPWSVPTYTDTPTATPTATPTPTLIVHCVDQVRARTNEGVALITNDNEWVVAIGEDPVTDDPIFLTQSDVLNFDTDDPVQLQYQRLGDPLGVYDYIMNNSAYEPDDTEVWYQRVRKENSAGAYSYRLGLHNGTDLADALYISKDRNMVPTGDIYADDNNGIALRDDAGGLGLFVEDGGAVGIKASAPEATLHVQQSALTGSWVAISAANDCLLENNDNAGLSMISANTGRIVFGDADDTYIGGYIYDHTLDATQLYSNNSVRLVIDADGDVGLGTTSPDTGLHLGGASAAITFNDITEPATPDSGDAVLWWNGTQLKIKNSAGTTETLTSF